MIDKDPWGTKAGLFVILWIVSWFSAIWVYHIQFFLTGLFCLFLGFACNDIRKNEVKKKKGGENMDWKVKFESHEQRKTMPLDRAKIEALRAIAEQLETLNKTLEGIERNTRPLAN